MKTSKLPRSLHQGLALVKAVGLVRNPYDLKGVLDLSDHLLEAAGTEDLEKLGRELQSLPGAVRIIRKRYRIGKLNFEDLMKRPKGSLGRVYVEHLKKNKITPDALMRPQSDDDLGYLASHLSETHDIWHVVTGFGTTVEGELGLAAFGAAQFPSQFNYLLLAGGLLNTVFYSFQDRKERTARLDAIARGWNMGRGARPFFGVEWSRLWDVPISKVRRELKIKDAVRPTRAMPSP